MMTKPSSAIYNRIQGERNEMKTFEEYLQEQFWKQYNGLDDEAPEAEADWMAELEPQDWIDYAKSWVADAYKEKQNDYEKNFDDMMDNQIEKINKWTKIINK
ncbi:MAG: hypothetical protein EOM59_14960 [Clostridia bacterium]|nr:hypothetical protein [Clostridia bacterium]